MDTDKPWYASKTLWVNALAIAFGALEGTGLITPPISLEVQTFVLAGVNIVLRILTKGAVVLS